MSGTKSLEKILESIVATAFADGDVLINLPIDETREGVQTVVELIEAHRIQTPTGLDSINNSQLIRHGVQYDSKNRVLGYWVKKADKVDNRGAYGKEDFDFIPLYKEDPETGLRRRVSFLFESPLNSRPLASRQYPAITPAISLLKNLDDFIEAIIVGARVAACFSAFIKVANPASAAKTMTNEAATETMDDGRKISKIQPGSVFYLKPNEEITFADPNKPSDNTDSFMLRNNKSVSMYFRVPYVIAWLDTEQVSYSAWRGAVLETSKMVNRWRRDLSVLIDLIVNTWVLEGIILGKVRGSLKSVKIRKRWPASGVLDTEKKARGDKLSLENKTISRQIICDEEGVDYDEVVSDRLEEDFIELEMEAKKLKRKQELEKEYGVKFVEEVNKKSTSTDESTDEDKERRKEDGNW